MGPPLSCTRKSAGLGGSYWSGGKDNFSGRSGISAARPGAAASRRTSSKAARFTNRAPEPRRLVGRVTAGAPQPATTSTNGAHEVTRPTLLFMESFDLQLWTRIGAMNLGVPASRRHVGVEPAGETPALSGRYTERNKRRTSNIEVARSGGIRSMGNGGR